MATKFNLKDQLAGIAALIQKTETLNRIGATKKWENLS